MNIASPTALSVVSDYAYTAPAIAGTAGTITVRPLSTWTGMGGNLLWSNAANWDALPNLGNVAAVSIPALANVTYDATMAGITSLQSLTSGGIFSLVGGTLNLLAGGTGLTTVGYAQSGGTLNGSGNFTVSNSFSQLGGVMALTNSTINITQATGDINLTNTGIASFSGLSALIGNIIVNNTGATTIGPVNASLAVTLAAHSPLTIGGSVTAGGNITLTAGATAGGVADILTLNGLVNSTAGSISLSAGNGIAQNVLPTAPLGTISALANLNTPLVIAPVVTAQPTQVAAIQQVATTTVITPVAAAPAATTMTAPVAIHTNAVTAGTTTGGVLGIPGTSGATIGGTAGAFGGTDTGVTITDEGSTSASGDGTASDMSGSAKAKEDTKKDGGKDDNKGKVSAKPEKC